MHFRQPRSLRCIWPARHFKDSKIRRSARASMCNSNGSSVVGRLGLVGSIVVAIRNAAAPGSLAAGAPDSCESQSKHHRPHQVLHVLVCVFLPLMGSSVILSRSVHNGDDVYFSPLMWSTESKSRARSCRCPSRLTGRGQEKLSHTMACQLLEPARQLTESYRQSLPPRKFKRAAKVRTDLKEMRMAEM